MLSPQDVSVLLVVGFLVFGANRLPEMVKSVGTGIREFKKGLNGEEEEQTPKPPPAA
ncbi:MAG: twin-arginine translocase TatA/TatE family subunit [Candidatus Xenobia bacterium]